MVFRTDEIVTEPIEVKASDMVDKLIISSEIMISLRYLLFNSVAKPNSSMAKSEEITVCSIFSAPRKKQHRKPI